MHVLLIGIDAYPAASGFDALGGCVNDIDAVQRILIDRLGVDRRNIVRLASPADGVKHETDVVSAGPATYENIRNALRDLASERIGPDDRVFIYYAGHGFTAPLAVDGVIVARREGLVPVDSTNGPGAPQRLLADVVINSLLRGITARTKQVTLILDSCHSDGATRSAFDQGYRTRGVALETSLSAADLDLDLDLDLGEGHGTAAKGPRGIGLRGAPDDLSGAASGAGGLVGDCQIVAACLADEKAGECEDGQHKLHGLLTQKLVALLTAIEDDRDLQELTWGRIWRSLVAVMALMKPQHASLTGSFARRVFSGPPVDGDTGHGVTRLNDTYKLDAGTLVGITEGAKVAVYGSAPAFFPPLDSPEDRAARLGLLKVITATRSSATAVPDPPEMSCFTLPQGARARLVERNGPARLAVGIVPFDQALADQIKASPLLGLVAPGERAAVNLEQVDSGDWALTDSVFGKEETSVTPVLLRIPKTSLDRARAVLEHYVRYSEPLRMAELLGASLPNALEITLLNANDKELLKKIDPAVPALPELLTPWCTQGDRFVVCVRNHSSLRLRVWLFDCCSSGQVESLGNAEIQANEMHAFWHPDKGPNSALGTYIKPPDQTLRAERIVAIGTTDLASSLEHLRMAGDDDTFAAALRPSRADTERKPSKAEHQWMATKITLFVRGARSVKS
jgi:hypothetical protein